MKIKSILRLRLLRCATLIALSTLSLSLIAQGTAFTYQGRLVENGAPANGTYDFVFRIYNVSTRGFPLTSPNPQPGVEVTNGLFTVLLDFGAVLDGGPRWLQIDVGMNGSPTTPLAPRQAITPTPYAIIALTVPDGSITAAQI